MGHEHENEDPYPECFEGVFEEYKDHRLDLIQKLLPENPVVFEAGAFNGKDTVTFAERWPKGSIFSFEPNPTRFVEVTNRAARYSHVHVTQSAVGAMNGYIAFYVCHGTGGSSPSFEGASSTLPPSDDMKVHYQGPVIQVPIIRLDDWCVKNGVDHIDFMWIDVEGGELSLLKGAKNILKKVDVIYTETNHFAFRKGMTLYPKLKAFLEKSGFRLLSHWYRKNLQGDAIFVREERFQELVDRVSQ